MSSEIETDAVHAGKADFYGAVSTPIFQSSTYELQGETNYDDIRYIRLNNTPNHQVLATRVAALEQTETALIASSGMSVISATLFTLLKKGDHVLVQNGIYGGSFSFMVDWFERLGVGWDFIDPTDTSNWAEQLRDETKVLYMETITNPTVRVADLPKAATFAKSHDLVSVVDNTFASPVNCRPAQVGFDLVIESATKYLNGHSDIVAGTVAGSHAHIDQIRHTLNHIGGSLDPHACFLLERGIKTLPLRVERQNRNATALATFMNAQSSVESVLYPGLQSHPEHELAKSYLSGFGGMLSFTLSDPTETENFLKGCQVATHAPSLGGVETLVVLPSKTSHVSLTPQERAAVGISDALIRVSVGIEHIDDLVRDFTR